MMRSSVSCAFVLSLLVACSSSPDRDDTSAAGSAGQPSAGSGGSSGSSSGAVSNAGAGAGASSSGGAGASGSGATGGLGEAGNGAVAGSGGMGGSDVGNDGAHIAAPSSGSLGASVSHQFTLTIDGKAVDEPLIWSLTEGALPFGTNLSPEGELNGRPIEAGTFRFKIKAVSGSTSVERELEWHIARFLAYTAKTDTGKNLFLLDAALPEAEPVALFGPGDGVDEVTSSGFSPQGKYLWAMTKLESGHTSAYLIDMAGNKIPAPLAHADSSAPIWSPSGNSYAYTIRVNVVQTTVFVNGTNFGTFHQLTSVQFINDNYVVIARSDNGSAWLDIIDIGTQQKKSSSFSGGASTAAVIGPVEIAAQPTMRVDYQSHVSVDAFWLSSDGDLQYKTSLTEQTLFSPNNRFSVRAFPAGVEFTNHESGSKKKLVQYPKFPRFSSNSRWFAGVRTYMPAQELFYMDLVNSKEESMPGPDNWTGIHGFCTGGDGWVAATLNPDVLALVRMDNNEFRSAKFTQIYAVDGFQCAPNNGHFTISGATPDAKRAAQLYRLVGGPSDRLETPRNLLASLPGATLQGSPQFSPDSRSVAFIAVAGSNKTLSYTAATLDTADVYQAQCGESPCNQVDWFAFAPRPEIP